MEMLLNSNRHSNFNLAKIDCIMDIVNPVANFSLLHINFIDFIKDIVNDVANFCVLYFNFNDYLRH
jgi:hypothetical protein